MVYINNKDNSSRFVLGEEGANPLFVFGVNPSTADDKTPDRTFTKIKKFVYQNTFDGFYIFNLYPLRSTNPMDLPQKVQYKLVKQNLVHIKNYISKYDKPNIWAAWGDSIYLRNYLIQSFDQIVNLIDSFDSTWYTCGSLTKKGQPRHPSRLPYKSKLIAINVDILSID